VTWAGRYDVDELALGLDVGRRRQDWNVAEGNRDAKGLRCTYEQGVALHVMGALGELAVKKTWELDWEPVWDRLDKTRPDVGNLHVRACLPALGLRGRLRIERDDVDDAPFVLVVLDGRRGYRIAGWLRGRRGKERWCYFTNYGNQRRPGAYFLPEGVLCPPWTCPVEAAP